MVVVRYLSSWLRPRGRRTRRYPRDQRKTFRPTLEVMEDRLPPGDLSGALGLLPWAELSDQVMSLTVPEDAFSIDAQEPLAERIEPIDVTSEDLSDRQFAFELTYQEESPAPSEPPAEIASSIAEPSLEDMVGTLDESYLQDPLGNADAAGDAAQDMVEPPTAAEITNIPTAAEDAAASAGDPASTADDAGQSGATSTPASTPGEEEQTAAQVLPDGSGDQQPDASPAPPEAPPVDPPQQSGGDTGTGPHFSVTLEVTDFTNQLYPQAYVHVTGDPNQPGVVPFLAAYVDVDFNRDGTFEGANELHFGFAWASHILYQPAPVNFYEPFVEGTFSMRARLVAVDVNEWVSPTVTMQVDPYAGYVSSDALRRLYSDYVLATTGTLDPFWSQPYAGQPPRQATESKVPIAHEFQRTSLTLEEFQTELRRGFVADAHDRVLVNVRATLQRHLPALQTGLESLGMSVTHVTPEQYLITGYLPIAQLPQVIALPHYASMTPVYPAIRRLGSVTTEGDAVMLADVFRNSTGATGANIPVGVISDSANRVSGGVASSQATGDLTGNVVIVLDGDPLDTDEGRAMMEIIQDVAPGAGLLFYTANGGPQAFATGIQQLAALGARVIVDDIGYLNEPFFNDGVIAMAVNQVVSNQNVVYLSAAGNDGDDGWMAPFVPRNVTLAGMPMVVHNFGGGDVLQNFTLPVGESITISFQWDSAFLEGGSPLPNYQVTADMDVLIMNQAGTVIFANFQDDNIAADEAVEFVTFTNNGTFGTTNFSMVFRRFSTAAPTMLRWVAFSSDSDPNAQFQGAPTIFGHPAAAGAIAVGAIDYLTPTVPESFTSLGGQLPFLFDASGNRLATPELRFKPEVAGPDGVTTTFFPGMGMPFFGTSAAAPHVAGAVALLLQLAPAATPAQILQHLQATALNPLGAGLDPLLGAGMVQLEELLLPLGPVAALPADRFEANETSDQPTDLGPLTGSQNLSGLTVGRKPDGLPDYDWFRWTAGTDGLFLATMELADDSGDLELEVFTVSGNTLVSLGQSVASAGGTANVSAFVSAGQTILVEVKGRNSALGVHDQGFFGLSVSLA